MNNFARQKKSDISFKSKAKTVIQESKHSLSYSLCKKKKIKNRSCHFYQETGISLLTIL